MSLKQVCIVVPIYLAEPPPLEQIGLTQILKVFKDYEFIFQVSHGIDTKWYAEFCRGKVDFRFKEFAVNNFIQYNKLLLDPDFFGSFNEYEFILICHLDAFPFRDELKLWCSRDYDIIGSVIYSREFEALNPTVTRIFGLDTPKYFFNGGFALYKVEAVSRILSSLSIIHRVYFMYHRLRRQGHYPLYDLFLSQLAPKMRNKMQLAPKSEAEKFGANLVDDFDLNRLSFTGADIDSLPFGVHGWYRWQFDFWRPHIRSFGYEV